MAKGMAMAAHNVPPDDSAVGGSTSRRDLLRVLTASPVAAVALPVMSTWSDALALLHRNYRDEPANITRTREGRSFSRRRYHLAEEFLPEHEPATGRGWHSYLYRAGIAAQLALSSHLLDVGFSDDWCARHVGLRVAKSLAYANATGFGHNDEDMARLAAILTPYCQWNRVRLLGEPAPDDDGFSVAEVYPLLRGLLDRVHDVTGHPRPNGWRRGRREARR